MDVDHHYSINMYNMEYIAQCVKGEAHPMIDEAQTNFSVYPSSFHVFPLCLPN